jgi:hypothetical protein
LGIGHDGPIPVLPEVVVESVPFKADGWVAGGWSRRSHLGCGQDARSRSRTVEKHSIDLVAEGGELLLEVVDARLEGVLVVFKVASFLDISVCI